MSDRGKKIFIILSIAIPFLGYCIYYYSIMIKNAPYKFTDFESFTFKYGAGDSLVNQYDSKTGYYMYLNDRDSLIKTTVRLKKDELLYLHRKAAMLGFWNFPERMEGNPATGPKKVPRYYLEYRYKEKSKKMLFDVNYNGNPKLIDAAKSLIDEVSKTINDAEDRNAKN